MKDFYKKIKEEFGQRYIRCSCIADKTTEDIFCEFLSRKKIVNALEIGTWFGVSSMVLSHYADKVFTIDIQWRPEPGLLWATFGVADKINRYERDSEKQKADIVDHLDFDFAFVDGNHRYDGVKADFELVKRCGRVLFHDYYDHTDTIPGIDFKTAIDNGKDPDTFGEVKRFIDELPKDEVSIMKPFALWERKDD